MVADLVEALLDCLGEIEFSCLDENTVNALLDGRDHDPFETQWLRVYHELESLKNEQSYTEKNGEEQERVCENAFMIIEDHIPGELSEYVSDDFGLIYDSLVLGYQDAWLDKLIAGYRNGQILTGEI